MGPALEGEAARIFGIGFFHRVDGKPLAGILIHVPMQAIGRFRRHIFRDFHGGPDGRDIINVIVPQGQGCGVGKRKADHRQVNPLDPVLANDFHRAIARTVQNRVDGPVQIFKMLLLRLCQRSPAPAALLGRFVEKFSDCCFLRHFHTLFCLIEVIIVRSSNLCQSLLTAWHPCIKRTI